VELPLPKYNISQEFIYGNNLVKIIKREIILDYDEGSHIIYYSLIRFIDNSWEEKRFVKVPEQELESTLSRQRDIVVSSLNKELPSWWNPKFKIGDIFCIGETNLRIKNIEYINDDYIYVFSKQKISGNWSNNNFQRISERLLTSIYNKVSYSEENIIKMCNEYGFRCKIVNKSIYIITPIAEWLLNLDGTDIILWHKNYLGNTNHYHEQRVYTIRETCFDDIIKYIKQHDTE